MEVIMSNHIHLIGESIKKGRLSDLTKTILKKFTENILCNYSETEPKN